MDVKRNTGARKNSSPVRVLVADRQPVVRYGMSLLLSSSPSFNLVGSAGTGGEVIELGACNHPDVVLLDIRFRDLLAPEIITELRRRDPNTKAVIFTASPEHAAVQAAMNAGARGVLPKNADRGDIVRALSAVSSGDRLPQPRRRRKGLSLITTREYDVLRRVALGQSNPEIAAAMFLSTNTVKGYLQNTLRKLGARNRIEAITKARSLDLL
ncbi:LuxR C-terminal-related transcriptional regulator [Saccharopolyspora sp. 5N102]|uniref:LuxR C-terminal-related transcriptional regulator n=1 Tax=Saccharopolyspora sp. 5N102 TaxID=3375155 RepID=UPI0037AA5FB1